MNLQLGAAVGDSREGGRQAARLPGGKVWVRELSGDGCQQLGELYRAEEGVPDMPGHRKECWSCQASRLLLRLSGRDLSSGKGTGGQSCQGTLEHCFFSRSTDEIKVGPWHQRNWTLTQ